MPNLFFKGYGYMFIYHVLIYLPICLTFFIIQVKTKKETCIIFICFPLREYGGGNSTNPELDFKKIDVNPERNICFRAYKPSIRKALSNTAILFIIFLTIIRRHTSGHPNNSDIATIRTQTNTGFGFYFTEFDEFQMCAL